jgi:hypothetical protein
LSPAVWGTAASNALVDPDAAALANTPQAVTTLSPSPPTTLESTTYTSGESETLGGSFGFNQAQGLNASISGSVTISNSESVTVPPVVVNYNGDPSTATTVWDATIKFPRPGLTAIPSNISVMPANGCLPFPPPAGCYLTTVTFFNQWIWEVPFSAYSTGQQTITFTTGATLSNPDPDPHIFRPVGPVNLNSVVPLPFGDTFVLQEPVVTGVSPSCVNSGDQFTIQGTGFYPSLVQSVLIGGTPVSPANITTVSDTQINVVAPDTIECHGTGCTVAVQTTQGTSNTNFTIVISDFCD